MATALKDIPFKSEFPTINEHGAFVDLKIGTPCDCGEYVQMTYNSYVSTPYGCGILELYNQCGQTVPFGYANCACYASCANCACCANCANYANYADCANRAYTSEYLLCNCGCGNSTTISYDELMSNPQNYDIVAFYR